MYSRIIVPMDGSQIAEQVLPYVRILGKGLGSRIQLLRVVDPVPARAAGPFRGREDTQIVESMAIPAQHYLGEVESSLRNDGLEVSSMIREGSPASCIVEEAEREPDTLIAMSTHGRSGIARWAVGSVTDKVLNAATNPLLIIRSRGEKTTSSEVDLKTLIIPLDGSPLAEQILDQVVDLAKGLGLKLVLVRVTPSAETYYRYMEYPYAPYQEFPDLSKDVDDSAVTYLHGMSQELRQRGIADVEERLLHGDPAGAIVDAAQETPDNLVAMTTHGRSGVGRWILGSVADRVVRHSGDPVLLIRAARRSS